MNLWQALQQVQYLLRQATWADAPGEAVFRDASVVVTNSPARESLLREAAKPFAIVATAGAQPHAEHPTIKTATIAVTIFVEQEGNPWGTDALLGAHRATTTGGSLHRGLLEVYRPVLDGLAAAGRELGLSVYLAGESDASAVQVGNEMTLLAMEFRLAALVHDAEEGEYPPVSGMTLASSGGGVLVSWTAPASRFDLASGAVSVARDSSEPASMGAGTLVADGTTAASVLDLPGAGTWFYGVAAKYDESSGTRFSSPIRTDSIVIP